MDTINISDAELESLTTAIQQRHGINFSCYEPKSLKRRLIRALHIFKLNAVHELWVRILHDRSFIYPLMDEISVGLTSMFRDPVLWRKLKYLLKHEFINRESLPIWHAGCSTGEEVYTMGIVLKESNFPKPVVASATDISNQALDTAKKGDYHILKLQEYEKNYVEFNPTGTLKKYYTTSVDSGRMSNALTCHVTFEYHNLITGTFDRQFDIIFCRNVMIYFDDQAKLNLFDHFHASLKPGGIFIIGFYDAVLPIVNPEKFQILDMDAKIFSKI